jgi:TRAP transporter 4TM/12TM fusion protein
MVVDKRALFAAGAVWLVFQFAIVVWPQQPLVERSLHLSLALVALFLSSRVHRVLDGICIAGSLAVGAYYLASAEFLNGRIEAVSTVRTVDLVAGCALTLLLLEGVRRAVGWSLLALLLVTLLYGFAGPWFPGWSRFSGFSFVDFVEILTMTTNGFLGVTTETSVQFVFYFLVFGVAYGVIGGGRLFLDIGLRASGRFTGGAAKAAVVSSSLMGTISGSAVANVVSVGVFTIPLMRRAGYAADLAAGVEAIASTGGQLMPPVMGVAAFVMAELLQMEYGQIALAAVIPAAAFYGALFLTVDFEARRAGIGTVPEEDIAGIAPIAPRLHLLLPPFVLIGLLAAGKSATYAVIASIAVCVAAGYLRWGMRPSMQAWGEAVSEVAKQAGQVAIPIAAIGMIIAVAVQSNLALRFSARLIEGGGGNVYAALLLTIVGCIVMGMGLPTVAAYIIGAVLFVPALVKLGIATLGAHFFVMYYCVLSMVTPPVALASFAAAGIAGAGAMQTSVHAFRMSLVLFLIPVGFAFDGALLGQGPVHLVALAFASLTVATGAWAAALVGHARRPLAWWERLVAGIAAVVVILAKTGSFEWMGGLAAIFVVALWTMLRRATGRSVRVR